MNQDGHRGRTPVICRFSRAIRTQYWRWCCCCATATESPQASNEESERFGDGTVVAYRRAVTKIIPKWQTSTGWAGQDWHPCLSFQHLCTNTQVARSLAIFPPHAYYREYFSSRCVRLSACQTVKNFPCGQRSLLGSTNIDAPSHVGTSSGKNSLKSNGGRQTKSKHDF